MVEATNRVPIQNNQTLWPHLFEPLKGIGERISDFFAPDAEASANGKNYEIQVELPGVAEKDIEVTLDERRLTVKGEKRFEKEEKGKTYFFSERSYGRFQRTFRLPGDVDENNIVAAHKDGVLTVKVGRHESREPAARRIPIGRD